MLQTPAPLVSPEGDALAGCACGRWSLLCHKRMHSADLFGLHWDLILDAVNCQQIPTIHGHLVHRVNLVRSRCFLCFAEPNILGCL